MAYPRIFAQLLWHDLRIGFPKNRWRFLLAAVLYTMLGALFVSRCGALADMETEGMLITAGDAVPGTADILLSFFSGTEVYVPSQDAPFQLPVFWMLQQVVVAALVASYPSEDLYQYAIHVIYRSRSRVLWWGAKCVWTAMTVAAFSALCVLSAFIFSWVFGEVSLLPNPEIEILINRIDVLGVAQGRLLTALAVPVAVSVAISLAQVLVSFILKPVIGFLAVVSYFILSVFFFAPYLIGDYGMFMRSGLVREDGLPPETMLAICVGCIAAVLITGGLYFKRMDLLDQKKDD